VLARQKVHDALERAAGRADAVEVRETLVTEPGARYNRFPDPRPARHENIMSAAMWGFGILLVDMRSRRLLKRLVATPMRRTTSWGRS